MFSQLKSLIIKFFHKSSANPVLPAAASTALPAATGALPQRIGRDHHPISRRHISEHALKVLYRLRTAGYQGYLVGGGVRDLLLGREPKDFDIATDASPDQVRELFRNCRLIGRRFRLAHVRFGREIIEVATFRAQHDSGDGDGDGRMQNGIIVRDNVYGSVEEDAWRRDFTVNALYYDINDFSVVDYTGGVADLEAGLLRMVGDPRIRMREDPVRMLRAVRFAAKLGFRIEAATESALIALRSLLAEVPPARLFDEVLKLFLSGHAVATYELLRHYQLFDVLFPATAHELAQEEGHFPHTFLLRALENTDHRISEGRPVTPAFLIAALLWEPVRAQVITQLADGTPPIPAWQVAGELVIAIQQQRVSIPRRFTQQSREIWEMQQRLTRRGGARAERLLEHPRFRAGYDFLLLREQAGEETGELGRWWSDFQQADPQQQQVLQRSLQAPSTPPRKRRRRRPNSRSTP